MEESKKKIAYIDAANIILALKSIYLEVDFLKLKIFLEDKFRLDEVYYFTADLEKLKESISSLRENNFNVITKSIYFENHKTKANCDVEISHHITKHVENNEVSEIILLSGDGDFSMLLDYAKDKNVEVKLMPANKKSTSKILKSKKFLKIFFMEELISKFEKEKTPAST